MLNDRCPDSRKFMDGYKIQINENVERDADGRITRSSQLLNVRGENLDEAVGLYGQLKKKLPSDESDGNKQERLTGAEGPEAPICDCGAPMVMRQNARKKTLFWGCSRYPKCHKSLEYVGFETAEKIPF